MQTRNDYERNVFNGDIGTVVELEDATLTVDFDGARKQYTRYDVRSLKLSYAMTIHKSQGLTLDSAFIDIRAAREPGQGYVALSRVRSVDGLHLKDWPRGVFVSQRAIDFHANTCR
jgi:ATP-dependent exoDNAse (exonuclease V) alpha subunit